MNRTTQRELRNLQQLANDLNDTLTELHDQLGGIAAAVTAIREVSAELPTV